MKNILNDLKSKFLKEGLDGFLITKAENVTYLTGFKGSFGWVFLDEKSKITLITDGRYETKALELCKKKNIELFLYNSDFKTQFSSQISGKIGIEVSMTIGQRDTFQEWFPDVEFVSQKGFIENIRRKKSWKEFEMVEIAQNHVDELLIPFLKKNLKTGVTEKKIAFDLEIMLRENGKYGLSFDPIIAFGENTALPHHTPSERKLKKGDPILVDCGVTYNGYCSDMTRMFAFGKPSKEFKEKYLLLLNAQEKTVEKLKQGENIQKLCQFCRDSLGDEAKYFTHSLGHGVGMEIHELPTLSVRSDKEDNLKPGDIITIEPGIYYPGKFGIRVEDLLFIDDHEVLMISKTSKSLIVFGD